MNGELKIWQTAVDSFNFAFEKYKTFFKLSIAPWIIFLITLIIGGGILISSNFMPSPTGEINPIIGFLGGTILLAGMTISNLMQITNFYRYIVFQEGENQWFKFRYDRHMWKLFKVLFIVFLIVIVLYIASNALMYILVYIIPTPANHLNFILFSGFSSFIFGLFYFIVRLFFANFFATTDVEKPITKSFQTTKGRFLKLSGYFLLVLFFTLVLAVGTFVVLIPFGMLEKSDNTFLKIVGLTGDILINILFLILIMATSTTSVVKAYQVLTVKTEPSDIPTSS